MTWACRRRAWLLTVAPVFLLLAACAPEQSAASASASPGSPVVPTRRDSAGVAILEYPADVAQRVPQWTVDTHPLAVIGDDPDGSDDVTHVFGAVLLSDGAVAFWDDARGQVAVYEPDGTERRRIGRRGQGPDEFGSMYMLARSGDTLITVDPVNDRIGLYTPTLAKLSETPGARICQPMMVIGRLPDGSYVADVSMFGQFGLSVTNATQRLPRPLLRVTPAACDTIGLFPGPDMRVIETRYRGRLGTQQVFVDYGRRTVSTVWDSLIAVGSQSAWQIDLIDPDGQVVRLIRLHWTAQPAPAGLKDTIIHRRMDRLHQQGTERLVDPAETDRLIREGTFVADSLPPYNDLLVGTDHRLWVVDAWAPGLPERSALAFSPSGTIEAHLTLPARYTPMAFGSDRVLTRVEDPETGVVTFRVLRMRAMGSR